MRVLDGETIYSATDLVGFAACEHLIQLELAAARGEIARPQREDPLLEVLSRLGDAHEAALLAHYPSGTGQVVTIDREHRTRAGLDAAAEATIAAMRGGAGLIYQATFLHDSWVGHADFLERVEQPSALGAWSYEVADAKLARTVRSSALVQLCEYSEHVARIQGLVPELIHVDAGDKDRHSYRLADFAAYHRTLKARFLETVGAALPRSTYPEPISHCGICRWWAECRDRRRADDHLSLVAGTRRDQRKHLVAAGIVTRHALAAAPVEPCAGIKAGAYDKVRRQAALQVQGEHAATPLHELLEPVPADGADRPRGFAALPAPSAGDLYLDLEGDPYALDGGLEYLFGLVELRDGEPVYHPFWGHTRADEAVAFRAAVDLIVDRRRRDPAMHVYHYASYEQSAFRRLMGAHGTREDEVDALLRGSVFVDLFQVVRQSVRLSTESYSLKAIEKLYVTRPDGAVMDAGSSIITYERYLANPDAALLDEIARYNRDDCESLIGLQSWLEARRLEAEAAFGPIARPAAPEVEVVDPETDERARLVARLLDGISDEPTDRSAEEQGRYLLAHLVEWHRREAKPTWWRYFDRLAYADGGTFAADPECIGGLEFERVLGPDKRSTVFRMRFAPQDHKFSVGNEPIDPATEKAAGTIVAIDEMGTIDLKRSRARDADPYPSALMPGGPYQTQLQRAAIAEVAAWVADSGIDAPGPFRAVRDLLIGASPRVRHTRAGAPLRDPDESALAAARRLGVELDHSYLPIQGPPGAGKTYTGAHMILALIDAGLRVGITATTHSAISNLLSTVSEVAAAEPPRVPLRAMQKCDDEPATAPAGVQCTAEASEIETAFASGAINLAAGTAWLWARPGLRDSVDVLFVDEAGQMSLADAVAVGTAARSIVLLGDPQQRAQPSQGSHPDGAGASALQHVLGEHATMPADRGLFLDLTHRMHPAVCSYISEVAYESRLESVAGLERQLVDGAAGVWFVPVVHAGDGRRSRDEADAVAELIAELVGAPWTDRAGGPRPLTLADIIVVAPYNAHVAELRGRLPEGARVGTVDKFQGREGAVAIYSTATSSAEEAPRGMDFLYDLHRLNVAVSRAQSRAYIVASPELLRVLCHTPDQLRLANALCQYVECADALGPPHPAHVDSAS